MHSQRRLEPGTFARMTQSCSEVAGQSIMFRPRVTMLLAATLMGSSISNVSNNTARHTPPTQRNTTKSKLKYEPSFSFFHNTEVPSNAHCLLWFSSENRTSPSHSFATLWKLACELRTAPCLSTPSPTKTPHYICFAVCAYMRLYAVRVSSAVCRLLAMIVIALQQHPSARLKTRIRAILRGRAKRSLRYAILNAILERACTLQKRGRLATQYATAAQTTRCARPWTNRSARLRLPSQNFVQHSAGVLVVHWPAKLPQLPPAPQ